MKSNYLRRLNQLCSFTIFIICAQVYAEEVSPQIDNGGNGYLEIGAGYQFIESPLYSARSGLMISLKGRYEFMRAFAEISSETMGMDGLLAVGFNAFANKNYSLDLYSAITDVDHEFTYRISGEDKRLFRERVIGSGLRLTRFWKNSQLQAKWLPYFNESFNGDSLIPYASIWFEHRLQIKNWSLSGLLGARYLSEGYLNYFYGISQEQADALLFVYEPDSGVDISAKLTLSYPITRNWVFESSLLRTRHADEITDAPIVKSLKWSDDRPKNTTIFNVQIKYVF